MSNNSTHGIREEGTLELADHVCQCIILALTVVGNFMLILSLFVRRGALKFVDKLMLNTVVCNLLLVLFSIPTALSLKHNSMYPFGSVVCKLLDPLSTCFLNSCVFTYIAIAFERWMVVSTLRYTPPSRLQSVLVLLTIHMCGLFSVTPYMKVLDKVLDKDGKLTCDETWNPTSSKSYTLSLFLLQYGIPVPLLIIFYVKTWFTIYRSNKKVITSMMEKSSSEKIMTTSFDDSDIDSHDPSYVSSNASSPRPCKMYSDASSDRERNLSMNYKADRRRSSTHSLLAGKRSQTFRRQRAFRRFPSTPAMSPAMNTTPDKLEIRSGAKRSLLYVKRYFSITGGLSMKHCAQIVAFKRRHKQTRSLLIRFTIIMFVFTICMLPNQVHWLLIDFKYGGDEFFSPLMVVVVHLVTYANCVINPLLYGHYNRKFRCNVHRVYENAKKAIEKSYCHGRSNKF